jgi:quinol monooxygenase YgiN
MLCVAKGFNNVISKHRLAKYMTTSMSSIAEGYLSVHVKGRISSGATDREVFYRNTIRNAKQSILEDGISRFDVLNRIDNNDEFLRVEVYNAANGPGDHKLTSHYNSWRENVADLMAEPRSAAKYTTLFPPNSNWKTDASASNIDDDSYMRNVPWNLDPFASSLDAGNCHELKLTAYVGPDVTCSLCLSIYLRLSVSASM